MTTLFILIKKCILNKKSYGIFRSLSRSKSRSRSHSFSPPPPGENGKPPEEVKPDEEEARIREETISALPPYFPALQVREK